MARLVAIDETTAKAREVAERAARWTLAAYIGPGQKSHFRQEVRTFGGKDPVDFYLEDVILHGTPESVADQLLSFQQEVGRFGTLLYAGKDWKDRELGRQSMILMAEKVMPRVNAGLSKQSNAAE